MSTAEAQVGLEPDFSAAIDFLIHFAPNERWTLVAIEPDPPEGRTARTVAAHFGEASAAQAMQWMARYRAWNLYYSVNEAAATVGTTPEKHQLTALRGLHVDLDLPRSGKGDSQALLRCIQSACPPATAIIFSGGGYQAIWRFPENLEITEILRVEAACRAVAENMAADHCWNANRLLRLPGTVNQLTRVKRARGRTPTLAHLVEADWGRTWSFADPLPTAVAEAAIEEEEAAEGRSVDDLALKLRKVITTGDASRWGGDRSRAVWFVCCELVRFGWMDEEILPVITDARYGISAHVRDQSKPERYARRQLAEVRKATATDWERRADGSIRPDSQTNTRRALVEIGVKLRHNEFAIRDTVTVAGKERQFDDSCGNNLRFEIDTKFRFRPPKEFFFDLCGVIARENSFHPVRDYLAGLAWDGASRIDTWLVTHCGAADTEYTRAVGRLSLVAAVRRIFEPGCVFDELLVLIDQTQGTGKSSALRALCPDHRWFTDDLPFGKPAKEIIEATVGKWLVEIAELSGMRRTEIEHIKSFLSRQAENARLAYGRLPTEVPRQWIPFGTTNQPIFLKDTANRRYWPVMTGGIDIEGIARDRDQIWAEAVAAHRSGESIRLDPKLWGEAAKVQEQHREVDPWVYEMAKALGDPNNCHIATADLFDLLNLPNSQKRSGMGARLAEVMRELGWNNNNLRPMKMGGKATRGWRKGEKWQQTRLVATWDAGAVRFCLMTEREGEEPF